MGKQEAVCAGQVLLDSRRHVSWLSSYTGQNISRATKEKASAPKCDLTMQPSTSTLYHSIEYHHKGFINNILGSCVDNIHERQCAGKGRTSELCNGLRLTLFFSQISGLDVRLFAEKTSALM